MKLVETMNDAHVGGIALKAGKYYVCSDNAAAGVVHAAPRLVRVVADAAPYTRHWRGQSLENKRLLIYRCLGLGDEFMAARLAATAAEQWPTAIVKLAIFDAHHEMWAASNLPFQPLPFQLSGAFVPFEDWRDCDYHVAGERWWENDATPDQPSAWDTMQRACGMQIARKSQTPYLPTPSAATGKAIVDFLQDWLRLTQIPIVLWQLAATSRIRSYPPERTREALQLLLDQTNANIVLAGHPSQIAAYSFPETPRIRVYSAGIEGLISMCHILSGPAPRACIVCPDSVLGHIAAGFPDLPVVSLWSSFAPLDRVGTYPNHRTIYNPIQCSPCRSHEQTGDPRHYRGCPLTGCNDYCAGLRNIEPSRILAAVKEVIP